MARSTRAAWAETRTGRLKLPVKSKPDWLRIGHGISLGYRRNQGPGTWSVRVADGKGGHWIKAIGAADDFDTADGTNVLDFWQAQDRARTIGLGARHADTGGKLATVAEAVATYEADLGARGGDLANAGRIRVHLPKALADKTVAMLAGRDFKSWRDGLNKAGLSPSTINRVNSCLAACLNLAADQDERIASRRAWEKGLAAIPDATESRNVILPEAEVRAIIAGAYSVIGSEFGALTEAAAVTGARVSQLARMEVQDLQADRVDPRLMMPTSKKGRGRKRVDRRPVPIPRGFAAKLAKLARERPADAPLLTKASGEPWKKSDHHRLFARVVAHAGLDDTITLYALRHTSIVRQLMAGVPIRVTAVNHDTSVAMIEKTYSRYIGDHSDALARRAILDTTEPPGANVVPIAGAR
jgi:integrase